jgi:hypothetical protein
MHRKNNINPPAIVRAHETLSALAQVINAAHEEVESALASSLGNARMAGSALIKVKCTLPHGSWLSWLAKNVKFSQQTASNYMRIAEGSAKLPTVGNLGVREALSLLHPPTVPEPAPEPGEEAPKPHVAQNSGEMEWYTPDEYIEAARAVLGVIDLDPASSDIANATIKAKVYYTKDDDGLAKEWKGKVWLNPPYARPLIEKFIAKLLAHYGGGEVPEAMVLVNNATETEWFQSLASEARAICFPAKRVRFLDRNGNPGAPLQGQALVYLGSEVGRFREKVGEFGFIMEVND